MDRGGARFLQRLFLMLVFTCASLYSVMFTTGPCADPLPPQPIASRPPRSLPDRPGVASILVTLALPGGHPSGAPAPKNSTAQPGLKTRQRHLHSKLKRAKMAAEPKQRARFLLTNRKLFQKSDRVSIGGKPARPEMMTKSQKLQKFENLQKSQKLQKFEAIGLQRTVYSKNASGPPDNLGTGGPVPRRENSTAQRRLPQALIIGVKKGGTRALLEFIRLHPDVRAVGPETHFFDRHFHKGLDWYREQMPPTLDSQLTMEKTPSYFVTREVPHRIRASMDRGIKLLVVVRDPVTRAISDYAQTVSKRRHMKSFDELTFLNNATGLVDTSWGAIKIGVYARHLEHWLRCFPLQQFHFVSGERLIKDPAGEMAKVQDFLGIRRIISENHFYFNETKGFPCLKKSEGNGSPRCLGKTKGRTHPLVDNSTIQNLRDFFRPFNVKFYQMTGVDFGWP